MRIEIDINCPKMTVCETHRQLYREIISGSSQKAKVLKLLREAFFKAKQMDIKLRRYSKNYDKGWHKDNPEYDPEKKTL